MTKKTRKGLIPLQLAKICTRAGAAVMPSHGLKDGKCTCDREDCQNPGAHPRTENGIEDATTDEREVDRFWTERPNAKVIIAMGVEDVIAVTVTGEEGRLAYAALAGGKKAARNLDSTEDEPEGQESGQQEQDAGEQEDEPPEQDASASDTLQFHNDQTRAYLFRAPPNAIPDGKVTIAGGVAVHGRGSLVVVSRSAKVRNRHIRPAPEGLVNLLNSRPILDTPFPETLHFTNRVLDFAWIKIPKGRPPCDDDKVRALADSYRVTGARLPLAARQISPQSVVGKRFIPPKLTLLSDTHQFEAYKRLGITAAECVIVYGNEADQRLWEIAELLHQPEVRKLDRALLVMEWVGLVGSKGGHVAHPRGGQQPHDKGRSAAERVLGISRRDLGRAEKIASICLEAQEEARRAKLDDNQKALLEIANQPPENQVAKVRELKDRYSKPRGNRKTKADTKASTAKNPAPQRQTPHQKTSEADQEQHDQQEQQEYQQQEDHSDQQEDWWSESPSTVPTDAGGDTEAETKFKTIKSRWKKYLADEWEDAPEAVRQRFVTEVLGFGRLVKKPQNTRS